MRGWLSARFIRKSELTLPETERHLPIGNQEVQEHMRKTKWWMLFSILTVFALTFAVACGDDDDDDDTDGGNPTATSDDGGVPTGPTEPMP